MTIRAQIFGWLTACFFSRVTLNRIMVGHKIGVGASLDNRLSECFRLNYCTFLPTVCEFHTNSLVLQGREFYLTQGSHVAQVCLELCCPA